MPQIEYDLILSNDSCNLVYIPGFLISLGELLVVGLRDGG